MIRPGAQGDRSGHHVDGTGETAFHPQPGTGILRRDRYHRDRPPVILPGQPPDELGLALSRARRGIEADERHPHYRPGAAVAGLGRAQRDHQERRPVLLGQAQGGAQRATRRIQRHDGTHLRRHASRGPDEQPGARRAYGDDDDGHDRRSLRQRRRRERELRGRFAGRDGGLLGRHRRCPLKPSFARWMGGWSADIVPLVFIVPVATGRCVQAREIPPRAVIHRPAAWPARGLDG